MSKGFWAGSILVWLGWVFGLGCLVWMVALFIISLVFGK